MDIGTIFGFVAVFGIPAIALAVSHWASRVARETAKKTGPFLCSGRVVAAIKKPTMEHAYGPGTIVVAGVEGPSLFTTHFVVRIAAHTFRKTAEHALAPVFPHGLPTVVSDVLRKHRFHVDVQVPVDPDEFADNLTGRSGRRLKRTEVNVLVNPFDQDDRPTFRWVD